MTDYHFKDGYLSFNIYQNTLVANTRSDHSGRPRSRTRDTLRDVQGKITQVGSHWGKIPERTVDVGDVFAAKRPKT